MFCFQNNQTVTILLFFLVADIEMKSIILEILQQACSIEELLKNSQYVVNGSVIIEWPSSFQLKKIFEIMLPSCLALYPRGTKLTFSIVTDTLHQHTMLCDADNKFVFV
jgi:hypothetical protein